MRFSTFLTLGSLAMASLLAAPLHAEPLIPERRSALIEGFDLPNGDIRTILDTTLEACERACLTDTSCKAFTYNARNASCFPKSSVGTPTPYDRAVSGQVLTAAHPQVEDRAKELGFLPPYLFGSATAQARQMGRNFQSGAFSAEALRQEAQSIAFQNPAQAARLMGAAANLSDQPMDWLDFGRLLLQASGTEGNGGLRQPALHATLNAYLRATTAPERHTILTTLAEALERTGDGRNALRSLRLAQELQHRDDTAQALERLASLYGFRIEDHEIESDLASPRICATFTEDLIAKGTDYTPFVQLPRQGLVVAPAGSNQLCVSGFEHGQRVALTFREGLPSADGQKLSKSVEVSGYIRDRSPEVRRAGSGFVLPRVGEPSIPVVTVNANTLDLEVYQVTDRNILRSLQQGWLQQPMDDWDANRFSSEVGEKVWTGKAEVKGDLNRDTTTRLPLTEALKDRPAGVYVLRATLPNPDEYDSRSAWQWFAVSDLGITSVEGNDGLTVVVRALTDAGPKAGAKVELLARSNRVLGTTQTDAEGVAHFDPKLTKGTGASAPALVTVSDGESDMAFLSLTDPQFDLSDRGVEGREPSPPIDLFLATDRGVYRVGEVIHATALARDSRARALVGLPLTARLRRPDGVEYTRQRINDMAGGFAISIPVAGNAPRGSWKLDILADTEAAPLATTSLLVEDFLPERIDFTLTLPETPLLLGATTDLTVAARYLFGAPGAGLGAEGEVILREAKSLAAYPGYSFGLVDQPFRPEVTSLSTEEKTDAQGNLTLPISLPQIANPNRPLEAAIRLRLTEGSGRPVEREVVRALANSAPLIGIKQITEGILPEKSTASFDLIALEAQSLPTKWSLDRLETRYQWYRMDGEWNWEPMTTRTSVASGEVTLGAEPTTISAPLDWGQYELTVASADGATASSTRVSAGWYGVADNPNSPDMLELSLDKPAYAAGDTARLRVVPKSQGTALITVLSDRVIAMKTVAVQEGENTIELPVTDDWGAGVYVTASVIRPMDAAAGRLPSRALGLAHAAIAPGNRQLTPVLSVPTEADPRSPVEITLKVDGVAAGEKAYATLAAVDVGILNLTGTKPPNPSAYYFGQRKLGVGIRDLYGRLIDGFSGAEGTVRSGGDAGRSATISDPPTEELVAWFAGPLEVGKDGTVTASFDLPAFNGTVKVMAITWSDSGIGQADADILVRDPIVATASLPRFMQPGDESRLLLEVVHATGPAGRVSLDVTANGVELGTTPSGFDLDEKGKATLTIPVKATTEGLAEIEVRMTTPEGRVLTKPLKLPIEAKDPQIQRITRMDLAAGESLTVDDALFSQFRTGTGHALISSGNLARLDAPGLLATLNAYPWGCTEQTTSRALPLLYLSRIATEMQLAEAETLPAKIAESIQKVLLNQSNEGGFGLWSAASQGDLWLDAYVTDFLSRARALGHEVPDRAFRAALDNLRSRVSYIGDFEKGGEDLAYALLVLAREGAAAIGDLRYYADTKADAFATPLALAQLGGALAAYGDQSRADQLFKRANAMALPAPTTTEQLWRADYGTALRDQAGVLALAIEAGSTAVDREGLTARIAAGLGTEALSTQEQAWVLMAAHGLNALSGGEAYSFGSRDIQGPLALRHDAGAGATVLTNKGSSSAVITLSAFGKPTAPEAAEANGYTLTRKWFTLDGNPADPTQVKQGTRLVTVLEVTPQGKGEARLMVTDALPAGFEIDNPNLLRSGQISALDWIDALAEVNHTEFRQDRFMAALDRRDNASFRLAYIVRAVSPGTYHLPAALVEDMYRPTLRGSTESLRVTVTE